MPSLARPGCLFSFANGKEPNPGPSSLVISSMPRYKSGRRDRVDAKALADIRRDDGRLKNESVAAEQLAPELADQMTGTMARARRMSLKPDIERTFSESVPRNMLGGFGDAHPRSSHCLSLAR